MALTYYSGSDFNVHDSNLCISDEIDQNTTSLILFYSVQCPHCKSMLQSFRELINHVSGINVGILNINKTDNKSVVMDSKYTKDTQIEYVPYILLFHNGKAIARYDDDENLQNLLNFINDTTQNLKQSFESEKDNTEILKPYRRKNLKRTVKRCYMNSDE
tara:strand:- start:263 stop:742 length:480 start_codon:yes stop_codon:yes gene_type:complete